MFDLRVPFIVVAIATIFAAPAVLAKGKPVGKVPAELLIENARTVTLTAFEIVHPPPAKPPAKPTPAPKPVLKLEKPLAPGEKVTLKLSGARGCSYLARWAFEDAGDEGPIDLCHDPKIVLTD